MATFSNDCTDLLNILEPGQTESVDELLERGKTQRVRILTGSESPTRKYQSPYARTLARIRFDNEEALRKCVQMLRWSDERLRSMSEDGKGWDWSVTIRDGMIITFGVIWHDRDFFERRRDAFLEPKHAIYYSKFGAAAEDFHLRHFIHGDPGYDEAVKELQVNAPVTV